MTTRPLAPAVADQLMPAVHPVLRMLILMLAGTVLLWVSARTQVPMWPVPMTMQTLAAILIGAWYGPRLGAATVVIYLAQGAAGLPVFASGGGLTYFLGPTGGYLIGFAVAAYVAGLVVERMGARPILAMAVAGVLGHIVVFVLGFAWLATLIGPAKAWVAGVAPFLVGSVVKTAFGAALDPLARTAAKRA